MVATAPEEVVTGLELRGGNLELFNARDREILVEGMAGTGKTWAILSLLNLLCHHFPGLRALIVRNHEATLSKTVLVTFNNKILKPLDRVRFFGGSKEKAAGYYYPNGSVIVVGGMGNSNEKDKILSSEYDFIYANEATELSLADWEMLMTRLRNGVLPNARIIGDCNPAQISHWLNQRCNEGKTRRIRTTFEDNPGYTSRDGSLTEDGAKYLATLDELTGIRFERFRLGLWAGVENAIYTMFDRRTHLVDLPDGIKFVGGAIGVDYGETHNSAAVAVLIDELNRRWVVEAWAAPSHDKGQELRRVVARMKVQYKILRGRTDPIQGSLAAALGFSVAKGSPGARGERIQLMSRVLGNFPGGRVPPVGEEIYQHPGQLVPHGPYPQPDSPGMLFVKGQPGIDQLCDEIEAYHFVPVETELRKSLQVARIDEDLVAALEYAEEELAEGDDYELLLRTPLPASTVMAHRVPRAA